MMKVITIGLFAFGIFLCIAKWYVVVRSNTDIKGSRKKNSNNNSKEKIKFFDFFFSESFFQYIITIVATVLGVTLAIICSNYDADRRNRNDTIALLEILDRELYTAKNLGIDCVGIGLISNSYDFIEEFETMECSYMLPLDVILTNEPYVSTLSSSTYSALLTQRLALNRAKNSLLNTHGLEYSMTEFVYTLTFIHAIIEVELQYQNKNISEREVEEKIYELYYEEAREFDDMIMEVLDALEDSEVQSDLLKLFEHVEE